MNILTGFYLVIKKGTRLRPLCGFAFNRFIGVFRRFLFSCQAVAHGGKVVIKNKVKFAYATKFQGVGTVILEDKVTLGFWLGGSNNQNILLQPRHQHAIIRIGSSTTLMNGCQFISNLSIVIGENCRIGPQTIIFDSDHHGIHPEERDLTGISSPVVIEDNVWVGFGVTILKGVRIGKDSVIGTRAVVSKNVPAGSIVVGNPMKIVGSVYEKKTSPLA